MGELLALTPADFDFEKGTVSITKSYQRIDRQDVITEPKTPKSNRTIKLPDFLCQEMREHRDSFYDCQPGDRLFPISKSYLHHEMDRGSKASGVKRIRVHDLRHSHVSHLIELGFSAVAFRMSPEEDAQLEIAVRLSGMTKQDYIIRRLQCRDVVVQGNPRVYKALRNELAALLDELRRLGTGETVGRDLRETIRLIAITLDGLKEG